MANPRCMSDDGNEAVFVGTMLANGNAVALCDECLVPWAAALLNVMTGVDPAPFINAISEGDNESPEGSTNGASANPSVGADALDPPPPRVKRGRMLDTSPDPGTDGDPADGTAMPPADSPTPAA